MTRQDAQHEEVQLAASEDREHEIDALDESDIAALIRFFKLLDRWDRENAKVM
jgi:hypothetical protein